MREIERVWDNGVFSSGRKNVAVGSITRHVARVARDPPLRTPNFEHAARIQYGRILCATASCPRL